MSWNDDDMNPWGKKEDSTNKKNVKQINQNDLDDLIKKGQDTVRNFMNKSGGSSGGNKIIISVVIFIALILWIATGFYRVKEGEESVVLRFGEVVRTAGPGLHYHIPIPIEKKYVVKVSKINVVNSGNVFINSRKKLRGENTRDLMLTGDENIIKLQFTVQWYVNDIKKFLFNDPAPVETVRAAAESAVREIIAQTSLAQTLTTGKDKIIIDSKVLLQKLLNEYNIGVEVVKVNLKEVNPPDSVIDSFRDVQRAKADKEKTINEAKAYRNSIIPVARGDAERIIKEAEANRAAVVNIAQGESARFLSVLKEYLKAPEVTLSRIKIQNSEKILKGVQKYIIGEKSSKGILPYFQLNQKNKHSK